MLVHNLSQKYAQMPYLFFFLHKRQDKKKNYKIKKMPVCI